MSILLAAAVVQAIPPSYPVPIAAPPAPPTQPGTREVRVSYIVDVDVHAEGKAIWAGQLRVAQGSSSMARSDVTQAPIEICPEARPRYIVGMSSGRFRIELRPERDIDNAARIQVSLSWTRPVESECPLPPGTRTIEFTQAVDLVPGRPQTITADGGVTVRLVRH
ncbi:hypothetical protein LZK98_12410 [Sphingomonas cannabina]|uniref:hypothetical protein n=1 Tax=Sphingomonas cannabina TaxID=2899123 RepID=UPI001F28A1D4|nr:hypothetical protein [Sphingomonas cannabina]UIJ43893.1 hypothetical protein LZK98_12410 [Sphingomonas cannabina]